MKLFLMVTYKKSEDGKLICIVKIEDNKTGEVKDDEFIYQPTKH